MTAAEVVNAHFISVRLFAHLQQRQEASTEEGRDQLVKKTARSKAPAAMTELLIRRKKGMSSVKEMPVLQDGPPPGGFPSVRYARRIPNSGPGGVAVFLVSAVVISYGFYQVGQGNRKRRYPLVLHVHTLIA